MDSFLASRSDETGFLSPPGTCTPQGLAAGSQIGRGPQGVLPLVLPSPGLCFSVTLSKGHREPAPWYSLPFPMCVRRKLGICKRLVVSSQAVPVRPRRMLTGCTILKLCKRFTGRGPHQFAPSSLLSKAVVISNSLHILSDLLYIDRSIHISDVHVRHKW